MATTMVAFRIAPLCGTKYPIRLMQTTAELPITNPEIGSLNPWIIPPNIASQMTQSAINLKYICFCCGLTS